MATSPLFGWEEPDDTDLVKDGAAAIRTLGNAIDTSMGDLLGGTTGQVLSKASNTNMDFTWVTSDDANAIQNTIVDAKGDLISATGSDVPARLAVGANGETLVADSSTATGLKWAAPSTGATSLGFTAGKNRIINGDFSINQRAFTSTTTAGYNFDRWQMGFSGGTVTASTQAFTAGTAPVVGYEGTNFARLVSASQSGTGDYAAYWQPIESVRTFANQTVTVSFWAKASTGTPNIGVTMAQSFGSGGSSTVVTSPAVQAITTSWVRYTFNVNVPSISGKTIGAGDYLAAWIMTSVGTGVSGSGYAAVGVQNATIDIWGVQVEAGSTATAFQTATGTIQGELAACQRYYWRVNAQNAYSNFATGVANSTTLADCIINLPVTMRVLPTVLDYSTLSLQDTVGSNTAITSMTIGSGTTQAVYLRATVASGLTVYRYYVVGANNSTSGYVGLGAEL